MTSEKRHREALSALLDAKDVLDELYTATCLLTAAKAEVEKLVEIDSVEPRRVCDRAAFLLSRFYEGELIPAMNRIDKALEEVRKSLKGKALEKIPVE